LFASIRRYSDVDESRSREMSSKVNERLLPRLNELPGFSEYYLIELEGGHMTSLSLFDTPLHADASSHIVAAWLKEEDLDTMFPSPPTILSGEVIVHEHALATSGSSSWL
jgi:hypothetical protein